MAKKTKIFLAIPTLGQIQAEGAHSLMELICDLTRMENEGYEFMLAMVPRMLVAQARELSVEKALEWGADYLLFVDDDHVLPRGFVKRLIGHNKDIVGLLSWERLGDHNPNIYKLHAEKKEKDAIVTGAKKIDSYSMKWRNWMTYKKDRDPKTGLLKVDVLGFGVALLNMRIFKGKKGLKSPYFLSQFQVGEDFYFCFRCFHAGFEIWADCHPDWHAGHLGLPPVLNERAHEISMAMKDKNVG